MTSGELISEGKAVARWWREPIVINGKPYRFIPKSLAASCGKAPAVGQSSPADAPAAGVGT